jgi:hypothetical protein
VAANAHPSSSVAQVRLEIAGRLRDLRLNAHLTGRALSKAARWHESKTSRIELAHQVPTDADIRTWCAICDATDQCNDLIAASRTAENMYIEWRRIHRTGLRHVQQSRAALYDRTRLMRVYCSNVIPGLFQTPGYAHALLTAITTFQRTPDDVDQAVAARIARNHVLTEGEHRFAVLIEEAALRYRVGDTATMAGQLGHLLTVMTLPSVALSIIPFTADRHTMWAIETFTIFDDTRVHVETLSAQLTITTPGETAVYRRAFTELANLAVTGAPARALITTAIDNLP